jgi:phytoene dehydrogenase-like protein
MVIIVGAGLAGLVCAGKLQENGTNFVLIEKSSRLGGRVGSLIEGGVIFDMGFQVLIDSYPAARELLDLGRLEPQYFDSGAIIWDKGRFYRLRRPTLQGDGIVGPATDDAISWSDKVRLALVSGGLMVRSDEEILSGTGDVPTKDYLRGFSDEALERFFRPFFGGILLDNDLQTSSILFRYYYRKFVTGQALVPRRGMQAIPDQVSARIPAERIRLNSEVTGLEFELGRATGVKLAGGERLSADSLVLACGKPATDHLLQKEPSAGRSVSVLYYLSERSLYPDKLIVLTAGRTRTLRHFVQLTNVAPDYVSDDRHLISATALKAPLDAGDRARARSEILEMFPQAEADFTLVKVIEIPDAVPQQNPGRRFDQRVAKPFPNVWLSGDQVSHASIQGAMESGLATARDILESQR